MWGAGRGDDGAGSLRGARRRGGVSERRPFRAPRRILADRVCALRQGRAPRADRVRAGRRPPARRRRVAPRAPRLRRPHRPRSLRRRAAPRGRSAAGGLRPRRGADPARHRGPLRRRALRAHRRGLRHRPLGRRGSRRGLGATVGGSRSGASPCAGIIASPSSAPPLRTVFASSRAETEAGDWSGAAPRARPALRDGPRGAGGPSAAGAGPRPASAVVDLSRAVGHHVEVAHVARADVS